jgi:hypothetical protein
MKRLLIALAVGSLAVLGSANAALLNFFEFGDKTFNTSVLFGTTPLGSDILFFQNPTAGSGLNPAIGSGGLAVGLNVQNPIWGPMFPGVAGALVYDASKPVNNVTYQSYLSKPNNFGTLPGGTFALGLVSSSGRVALSNISETSGVPGSYQFSFADGSNVWISHLTQVPIPAAGLLFLSAIGGLLLVARRNRARNRVEERVGEPLPA